MALLSTLGCKVGTPAVASLPNARPSTLSVDPALDAGPFRVVFAGADDAKLTLAFSRPIMNIENSPVVVRLRDRPEPLTGMFEWFGERIAVFTPSDGFALATTYEAWFDPGLRSRDGALLGAVPAFAFTTSRPSITRARYAFDASTGKPPSTSIEFDRSVSAEWVRARLRVEGSRGRGVETIPISLDLPENADFESYDTSYFDVTLDREARTFKSLTLVMSSELGASNETRITLKEAGPLLASIRCTPPGKDEEADNPELCSVSDFGVWLVLSKPATEKELVKHLMGSAPRLPFDRTDDFSVDTFELGQRFQLEPGKTYRVRLTAGLKTADGETSEHDQLLTFTTADLAPSLQFRGLDERGNVVEAARREIGLGIDTTNVSEFDVSQAPLSEAALLEYLAGPRTRARMRALPDAESRHFSVRAGRNTSTLSKFSLSDTLRPRFAKGLFALAATAPGVDEQVRLLSVTDLALTTKWSPHGGLVWVTHLSSAKPEVNAKVALFIGKRQIFGAITDAQGIALIPESASSACAGSPEPVTLVVRTNDDIAVSELGSFEHRGALALGHVFTDRRLYRPGESVFVKGYFREPTGRGLATPKGQRVELTLRDDQGRSLTTHSVAIDEFGAFSAEFALPRDMRLGGGCILAELASPEKRTRPSRGTKSASRFRYRRELASWFQVSEYRVVDMKVTLAADKRSLVRGQTVKLRSDAEYLFGAKLHDVPLTIEMSRSRASFVPVGLEQFAIDSRELWRNRAEPSPGAQSPNPEKVVQTRVGADGVTLSSVTLALPDQTAPENVTFDVAVSDASRAFQATDSVTVLVHPAELYLGLRIPRSDEVRAGASIHPEALVVTPSGMPHENVAVRFELLHFEDDELKQSGPTCQIQSRARPSGCALKAPRSGTFYVRASASDPRGNPLNAVSSLIVYERRDRPVEPEPAPPAPESAALQRFEERERPFAERCLAQREQDSSLLLERERSTRHRVGDALWVCARGPTPLLATLEREGVLYHELIEHPGTTMLKYLITPNLHPNFVLSLHGATPRTASFTPPGSEALDRGSPSMFSAEEEVLVTLPARRQLAIDLKTKASQAPGTEANIRLQVRDGDGNPVQAQVTLWAVDEGAFLLRPFGVPVPNDTFGDDRSSDVQTVTSESSLYSGLAQRHTTRAPKIRMGATQTSHSAPLTRSLFKSTAFFLPNIVTDADGSKTVKALLPDNLTTWKVFAVAASASDAFGSAEASFKTERQLVAHPILPRFLRAGDRFEATLAIDSLLSRDVELGVFLSTEGALSGGGHQKIRVRAKGNALLHFPILAQAAGSGALAFQLEGPEGLGDSVSQTLKVEAPTLLEHVVWSGSGEQHRKQSLGDLSGMRNDVGALKYHVSKSPLVGLSQGFDALLDYPYGCSEQLASRILPLLRLQPLARSVGVALPSDIDAHIRSGLTSLLSHQRADGGFGFWPGSGGSDVWLTAWVVFALESARERGFAVPSEAREQALDYLVTAVPPHESTRAVVESMLALVGRPRKTELEKLANEPTASRFARALVAYTLAKLDPPLAEKLTDSLLREADVTGSSALLHANVSSNGWFAESDAVTTAATLRAVLSTKPAHELIPKLIRGLLSLRHAGAWENTQANAWALFALDDARRSLPEPSEASALIVSLAGKRLATKSGSALSGAVPLAALQGAAGPLEFGVEQGTLYYEATLEFARRAATSVAVEHGIYVSRRFTALAPDGAPRPAGVIFVGDHVRVDALLMSPTSRQQVVLDDPIPAGFDALDETDFDAVRDSTHRELRDNRVLSFFDELSAGVTHAHYVLRAISPGEYSIPQAKAECMYQPDVYGFTAPEIARVVR